MEIKDILQEFKENKINIIDAESEIRKNQYQDLGYARIDHNRKERVGVAEVVLCEGKTNEYLAKIYEAIYKEYDEVLGTRASNEQFEFVKKYLPNIEYDCISKILKIERKKNKVGCVVICTAGTSDIPVAEEAKQTAEFFGSNVKKVYDVGVAGIHRILSQREVLNDANCIIVVAGMDGALPSVVAGISKVPIIAVPTSIRIWCKLWRSSSTFKYDKCLQ